MLSNVIIPEILQPVAPILSQYLQPLLLWLSQLVYQQLLARQGQQPLVCLAGLLDFGPLERACAAYQTAPGRRGHPAGQPRIPFRATVRSGNAEPLQRRRW